MRVRVYQQALVPDSVIYTAPISAPLGLGWTPHRLPRGFPQEGNQRVYVSVASEDNALAYNENDTISHYSYYRFPDGPFFYRLDSLKVALDGEEKILVGNWSIRLSYLVPDTSEDEIEIPLVIGYFYPNPFIVNRTARAEVRLEISPGKPVEVRLYNILGQEIWRQTRSADVLMSVAWQGVMKNGRLAPSGVYLARVVVGETLTYRKLVLIR